MQNILLQQLRKCENILLFSVLCYIKMKSEFGQNKTSEDVTLSSEIISHLTYDKGAECGCAITFLSSVK